ncbi:MAG: glycosyltransferase [bacterium]|nr:glycosyltransferase [bacterium]
MKIAFLNIYQGVVDRGAENFVKEVSSRLGKEHKVDIYSLKGKISEDKARSQTSFSLLGKVLYKISFDAHSIRVLFFTFSIIQNILKNSYEWIIPVDGGWQVLILKVLQLIKLGKFKILISGQAGIGRDDLRNLRVKPDIFVALTSRAEIWAKQVTPKTGVVKIPNGVNLEIFNPSVKPAKVNLEKPIIICVAGLNPYKRVDLSIKSVAEMNKGSLLLLGDGPQCLEIDELGRKILGSKRFLRLTVPYNEIASYYKIADLFTLVSESSEAFGSAYVEAMASGLPVVATDDETRREVIGEAGLFVNPENTEEYAKALEKALKTNWGDKPRKQAEKFSWDEIAKEYEKAMSDMLK